MKSMIRKLFITTVMMHLTFVLWVLPYQLSNKVDLSNYLCISLTETWLVIPAVPWAARTMEEQLHHKNGCAFVYVGSRKTCISSVDITSIIHEKTSSITSSTRCSQVLVPRTEVGVIGSNKRKRFKKDELTTVQQAAALLDITALQAANPARLVKAYKVGLIKQYDKGPSNFSYVGSDNDYFVVLLKFNFLM
jgi:hypothetical protein